MDTSWASQATAKNYVATDTAEVNEDVGAALRSDLKSMHVLATCSICDQLLYEPWTIACGHTYCYSCLCSWFSQDKRKKSCPECRSKVKAMPAPCFLIKKLVEVILQRSDTIADESIEQHQKKRAEEIALVDIDRKSSMGLFKGMFSIRQNKLWRDDTDGVFRCAGCGFEHEGGPLCSNCGEQVEEDDDYDLDADDNATEEHESFGFGIDAESEEEEEIFNMHNYRHFQQHVSSYIDVAHSRRATANASQGQFALNREFDEDTTAESDSEASELSVASDSCEIDADDDDDDDDDDDSSLQNFIAPDDENDDYETRSNSSGDHEQEYQPSRARQRHAITLSDDDSDEGGSIWNRKRRNNSHTLNIQSSSPAPSVMTITDAGSDDSGTGDHVNTTETWGPTRWSPLNNSNDSDKEIGPSSSRNGSGYNHGSDEESNTNTETLVDREMSDDEDGEDNNSSQIANFDWSRSSTYSASNQHHNTHFYGFSQSDDSQSTDEDCRGSNLRSVGPSYPV